MITLHHLNQSRSKRIIWLLEELGVEYQIESYMRDSVTFLAPPELRNIHPLGKSPVIESDGLVIAESGAITEYLITKYGLGKLAPEVGTNEYVEYLQWIHFAESSGALPILLKIFVQKDGCKTNFLDDYAESEMSKIISYLDTKLQDKDFLVGDQLTGADIMVSFLIEYLEGTGRIKEYKNIQKYAKKLSENENFKKANLIEKASNKNEK